jgi:predicted O-methyltransferase YrrM
MTDTTVAQSNWCASKVRGEVKYVLDIGVNHGTSTILWLTAFPKAKVMGIDIVPLENDIARVKAYGGDRFDFIPGDSQLVIDEIPTIFDFIYIDTAHDRLTTFRELVAAWSKLRYGGVLAGHDYHYQGTSCRPNWPGDVKNAVDVFCKYMNVKYEVDVVDDPTTGCFAIYKNYAHDETTTPPKVYNFAKPGEINAIQSPIING